MHGSLIIYVHHFLLVSLQIGVLSLQLLYSGYDIGGNAWVFCKESISHEAKVEWIEANVVEITNALAKPSRVIKYYYG